MSKWDSDSPKLTINWQLLNFPIDQTHGSHTYEAHDVNEEVIVRSTWNGVQLAVDNAF